MRYFLTLALVSAALAQDANWPQFRGRNASGVGSGTTPLEWSGESSKNVQWKTAIPGLGYSSPVVWGDKIFLTSAVPAQGTASVKLGLYGDIAPVKDDPEQSFNLYCLDRRNGKILWTRTATSGMAKVKRHPKSSHANPTAATDGKYVVAFFGSEGIYTYDLNGKLIWKKDLGTLDSGFFMVPSAQWGFSSSPVIHDGMIIIQADVQKDSFVAAFDLKTGKELWRTARADVPTFGTPAVIPTSSSGGPQVVLNGWKHIGGYELKTGKEIWRMKGAGDIPVPTPVFANDRIVITSAHGPGRPIFAIKPTATGDLSADKSHIAWTQDRVGNYMQTPLLHDGIGYFCFDNGVLTAFQLATGERLYQQRLGTGKSGFSSSPVAANGRLYITNEEGHTYVVALGGEYKLLGENDLGEAVMASPAISNGVLFLRGASHLYAIGEKKR